MLKNVLAGVAAAGLVIAPVAASANTRADTAVPAVKVASLKVGERTTATVEKKERLAGGSGILIGLLAAAAVIGGIVIAADDDDSDG